MTRARTETIAVKPQNNVYTALAGSACVACLLALVFTYMKWQAIVGDGSDAPKLFFGLF